MDRACDPAESTRAEIDRTAADVLAAAKGLAVGAADGVGAIPRTTAADAIRKSREQDGWEAGICPRLMAGDNTQDLFGWRR